MAGGIASGPCLLLRCGWRPPVLEALADAVDGIASFAWTPSTVRDLVMRLSSAMSDEVDALTALGDPWAAPRAAA